MKTEKELNVDILEITMIIAEEYPELMKYIGEMQITLSDDTGSEGTIDNLKGYYQSLSSLVNTYKATHIKSALGKKDAALTIIN